MATLILCDTCRHIEYCPLEPKTVLECAKYKADQRNLFNEAEPEEMVQISGDDVLAKVCNHLLSLLRGREKELLSGKTIGEIDRRICAEVWLDEGLNNIIPADKRAEFLQFMQKSTEAEVITRARRYLVEKDRIRLPQSAIVSGERFRARIAGSMR